MVGALDDPAKDHDLGKYACLSCDMSFRGTPNLRRHVKLVHEARMIPCPWCKMDFNILAEMVSHKEICKKVCPYPDCGKKFKREDKFEGHLRAHLVMARRMSDI